jgi:hypothetical protein
MDTGGKEQPEPEENILFDLSCGLALYIFPDWEEDFHRFFL